MAISMTVAEKVAVLELKRARWNTRGQVAWLFQNDYTPTPYSTLANFNPSTVNGVHGRPVTWPAPAYDAGDGTALMIASFVQWTPTGIVVQNTIYGYFVVDVASGLYIFGERLAPADIVTGFGADLRPITFTPRFRETDAA